MKFFKVLSVILALSIVFSVGSFAATTAAESTTASKAESTTEIDNATEMDAKLKEFIKKNDIDPDTLSFAYYDFGREMRYEYQGERLFAPYEAFKFPLAYIYFKDLVNGKHHLNEDVGDDNLRTVYYRSISKDYGHDASATKLLIENYGGMKELKQAMYETTYTKVDDAFFESDALNAEFALDFLIKYYAEALYCSTDFKQMLIDPIKQISPGRFSETNVIDYKITHRYGYSKENGAGVDMGIINSENPFAFVIAVEGSEHYEKDVALLAEFATDFNEEYSDLLRSQLTTLPDVPEQEKKGYDATKVTETPLMIIVIVSTVVIAAGVTTVSIVLENKKKKRDRLD